MRAASARSGVAWVAWLLLAVFPLMLATAAVPRGATDVRSSDLTSEQTRDALRKKAVAQKRRAAAHIDKAKSLVAGATGSGVPILSDLFGSGSSNDYPGAELCVPNDPAKILDDAASRAKVVANLLDEEIRELRSRGADTGAIDGRLGQSRKELQEINAAIRLVEEQGEATGCGCSSNLDCASARCDLAMGSLLQFQSPNPPRCIPNDFVGKIGDYCSHNNQCSNRNCFNSECRAPAALGQACETNRGCVSGACEGSVCVPPNGTGKAGDFCSTDRHCKSNACRQQKCLAMAKIGERCDNHRRCAGGRRCDSGPFTQNTNRCVPNDGYGLPNQFCSHNNQCRPGRQCVLLSGRNYGSCN